VAITLSSWRPVAEPLLAALRTGPWPWAVMKNHEHLPNVPGDIDLCVAKEHWDAFTRGIVGSLNEIGIFGIVDCDHFVGVRLIFIVPAAGPAPEGKALEVDLADGVWWKGTLLCPPERILSAFVTHVENGSVPHTRVGFQAALTVTVSGIGHDGVLHLQERKRGEVERKAWQEPETFARAMEVFHGPVGVTAAEAFLTGTWTAALGRSLIANRMKRSGFPRQRASNFIRRKMSRHWRGLPRNVSDPTTDWLARTSRGHRVLGQLPSGSVKPKPR
jgi:hypothetical protein